MGLTSDGDGDGSDNMDTSHNENNWQSMHFDANDLPTTSALDSIPKKTLQQPTKEQPPTKQKTKKETAKETARKKKKAQDEAIQAQFETNFAAATLDADGFALPTNNGGTANMDDSNNKNSVSGLPSFDTDDDGFGTATEKPPPKRKVPANGTRKKGPRKTKSGDSSSVENKNGTQNKPKVKKSKSTDSASTSKPKNKKLPSKLPNNHERRGGGSKSVGGDRSVASKDTTGTAPARTRPKKRTPKPKANGVDTNGEEEKGGCVEE